MLAFLISDLANIDYYFKHPWLLVVLGFQLWMLVDSIRREEWMWAVFIVVFPLLNALLYFFMIYRSAAPSATLVFELPGAVDRRRIKELEAQIHHLDKAHHHSQLGDIYFHQGKLAEAEKCYQAALERDGADLDTRAHLGQCLLRQNRAAEALPILEKVCAENPRHDYGHSQMALAEAMTAAGQVDAAMAVWERVLESNSYARARVQLAELHLARQQPDVAQQHLRQVVEEDQHALKFQRKRERFWVQRARKLLKG